MKSTGNVTVALALVTLLSAPVVAQQPSGTRRSTADIQGFNIVLLVGETEGTSAPADDLPQGARRALSDMKEFLPYKHYRVLDSQWTSCCGPESTVNLSGRLQGVYAVGPNPGDIKLLPRPYDFSLNVRNMAEGLQVQFSLREEGSSSRRIPPQIEREIGDARDELATVEVQMREMQGRVQIGTAAPIDVRKLRDQRASLQRKLEALQEQAQITARAGGARTLINSSFTMDVGETVVVGTSRLGGDKALIALVTAAKRGGSAAREE